MKKNIVFKVGGRYLKWHLGEFDYYNAITFAQSESKQDYIEYMKDCLLYTNAINATQISYNEELGVEDREVILMRYIPQIYKRIKEETNSSYTTELPFPSKMTLGDLKKHFGKVFEEKVEIELI